MSFNIEDAQKWVDDIGDLADDSIAEIAKQIGLSDDTLKQIAAVAADYQDEMPKAKHVYGSTVAGIFIGIKWCKEQHKEDWESVLKG